MNEMQNDINRAENTAVELLDKISGIDTMYSIIVGKVNAAREIAKYLFDNPTHHTNADVAQKAGEILEALDGI